MRKDLARENLKWPVSLKPVPRAEWPRVGLSASAMPIETWRSRGFLVAVFAENAGVERLTICRTTVIDQDYADNISWDDLQRIKSECGRGDREAVEVFPPNLDVVNVANMRHLWVLPAGERLAFSWRRIL
jgi:hypothetical protein